MSPLIQTAPRRLHRIRASVPWAVLAVGTALALATSFAYRQLNPGWVAFHRGMNQLQVGEHVPAGESLLTARAEGIEHPRLEPALARIEIAAGKFPEAQARLEAAVLADPTDLETVGVLAGLHHQNARVTPAIHLYLDVEAAGGQLSDPARLHLADLYREARLYPEADSLYADLIAHSPELAASARLHFAQSLAWRRQYDAAIATLREILAADPGNRPALLELARVLNWAGRPEESTATYRQLLQEK